MAGLAATVPRLLTGTDTVAYVDIGDTIRWVHGYQKQGAAYGYSGVKGLNAQIAAFNADRSARIAAKAPRVLPSPMKSDPSIAGNAPLAVRTSKRLLQHGTTEPA